MKNKLLFSSIAFLFLSCGKEENKSIHVYCEKEAKTFQSESDIKLLLEKQNWHLSTNSLGGYDIFLKVAGEIVGDSAKITSYGDGLLSEVILKLDNKKKFAQEVGVFFTAANRLEEQEFIVPSTKIQVFKGDEKFTADIEGCKLKNPFFKK